MKLKSALILALATVFYLLSSVPSLASGVNGDAQISGMFDGSPIVIRTTSQLAGAVDSLTWKGVNFVDSGHDHGRQIQYAWNLNGKGECNNPTEAGSADDANKPTSTSILLSLSSTPNSLTTMSNPAYWLAPGQTSGWCPANTVAQNTTSVSSYTLKKTVTIGAQGIPNAIEFLADITVPDSVTEMNLQSPISCQLDTFSKFWTYDPRNKQLSNVSNSLVSTGTGSKSLSTPLLPILSTSDQTYAIGAYIPDLGGENQGARIFNLDSFDTTYVWPTNIIEPKYSRGATVPGTYRYRSYFVIGTVAQVTAALDQLYLKVPAILETPTDGYLGATSCQSINGWSGWKENVSAPTNVSFYSDGPMGIGQQLGTATTSTNWGPGTCQYLNGTNCDVCSTSNAPQCMHGFNFVPPANIKDGVSHQIYAYGLTPSGMPNQLNAAPMSLTCSSTAQIETGFNAKVSAAGFNLNLTTFKKNVDELVSMNQKWIRFDIPEFEVATAGTASTINWNLPNLAVFDQAINYANSKGLKIFLVTVVPYYANQYSVSDYQSVARLYYQFMANRYKGKIAIWQIYTEPDLHNFRNYSLNPNPLSASYVSELNGIVSIARTEIKAQDPTTLITVNASGYPLTDSIQSRWFQMFDVLSPNLDILSLNPYPDPANLATEIPLIATRINNVRNRYGKQVAVSETGTCNVTEAWQKTYLPQYIASAKSASPNPLIVYELQDEALPTFDVCESTYGIKRQDGSTKLGYGDVMKAMGATFLVNDINTDGKIDLLDLARIINKRVAVSVAVSTNTPEDLNNDLKVDATDLQLFLQNYTHL